MRQTNLSQDHGYHTTDIFLASYLIAKRFATLNRIESVGARRKLFVLSPEPSEEQIQSFYARNDESKVIARDIIDELRNLKSLIMNQGG
jgi:hypothetical protein